MGGWVAWTGDMESRSNSEAELESYQLIRNWGHVT